MIQIIDNGNLINLVGASVRKEILSVKWKGLVCVTPVIPLNTKVVFDDFVQEFDLVAGVPIIKDFNVSFTVNVPQTLIGLVSSQILNNQVLKFFLFTDLVELQATKSIIQQVAFRLQAEDESFVITQLPFVELRIRGFTSGNVPVNSQVLIENNSHFTGDAIYYENFFVRESAFAGAGDHLLNFFETKIEDVGRLRIVKTGDDTRSLDYEFLSHG